MIHKLSDKSYKLMRRSGYTTAMIAAYQIAMSDEFSRYEDEINRKAYLLFQVIGLNILCSDDYFGEDEEKIKAYYTECENLLDAVRGGYTKWQECVDLFESLTGETIDLDLLGNTNTTADQCRKKVEQ